LAQIEIARILLAVVATSPKNGLSQGQCYEAAGFRTNGRSADACAARLWAACLTPESRKNLRPAITANPVLLGHNHKAFRTLVFGCNRNGFGAADADACSAF
jgi:hypothetical protein